MALMLPSLTQQGKPPGAKAPVHSHTEVPGGTWHMDITSPTVDRSQADGPTATRSQQQKAAAVQKAVAARSLRRAHFSGMRTKCCCDVSKFTFVLSDWNKCPDSA